MDHAEIPIFPLAQVVLFPSTSVPLYIFEQRYREMISDALEGERRIGMVTVRPEAIAQMEEDPAVFSVGCEGRILHCQRKPDGTFDVVLQATARFRILREDDRPAGRLYRVATVERLPEPLPEDRADVVGGLREDTLTQLRELLDRVSPDQREQFTDEALSGVSDAQLVNALALGLNFTPLEKQQLLEAPSTLARYEALADLLRFKHAELTFGTGGAGMAQ